VEWEFISFVLEGKKRERDRHSRELFREERKGGPFLLGIRSIKVMAVRERGAFVSTRGDWRWLRLKPVPEKKEKKAQLLERKLRINPQRRKKLPEKGYILWGEGIASLPIAKLFSIFHVRGGKTYTPTLPGIFPSSHPLRGGEKKGAIFVEGMRDAFLKKLFPSKSPGSFFSELYSEPDCASS